MRGYTVLTKYKKKVKKLPKVLNNTRMKLEAVKRDIKDEQRQSNIRKKFKELKANCSDLQVRISQLSEKKKWEKEFAKLDQPKAPESQAREEIEADSPPTPQEPPEQAPYPEDDPQDEFSEYDDLEPYTDLEEDDIDP